MNDSAKHYPNLLICIGASAGGLRPVLDILRQLPENLSAIVLVAMHRGGGVGKNVLADLAERAANLKVNEPVNGEFLHCATIYIGEPMETVTVDSSRVWVHHDTSRLARMRRIDELFTAVAEEAGPNAVGVILSGMLDDGVAGMRAIADAGGHCLIQSPREAEFDSMPRQALAEVRSPELVGSVEEIVERLKCLAEEHGFCV